MISMPKQITVDGREGPLGLSLGERVCVPHNIRGIRNGSITDIARIADQFTEGREGVHVCYGTSHGTLTIVVRGQYEIGEEHYAKVRAVWHGDSGSKQNQRGGLPVYRKSLSDDSPTFPYQGP